MYSSKMHTAHFSGRLLHARPPATHGPLPTMHTPVPHMPSPPCMTPCHAWSHLNRITDRCKNITFLQLRLRTVINLNSVRAAWLCSDSAGVISWE